MESLAQPPPPPAALKMGGGGAAGRIVPEETVAESGRGGPATAGQRAPSPPPLSPSAAGAGKGPPSSGGSPGPALEGRRPAGECAEAAGTESSEAAPAAESGVGEAGSSGDPSPPEEESRSLDSLESFSNLHSCCPSSSELNSDAEEATAEGKAPDPGGDGPPAAAQLLAASKERFPGQSVYHIKWVRWKEENTPIITQNENGPCPLLAIMNVLLLAWKVPYPSALFSNCLCGWRHISLSPF
uniref:Ubiquitin carboxyl-terminal hydrolase n=1 Tax=Pelusios castaneus TaxID=367368 RepID=A0A8C8RTA3_9SAUR